MDKSQRAEWGIVIRDARRARDLKQQELADLAGVTRNTIGNIERGSHAPRPEVLERVREVLGLDDEPSTSEDDIDAYLPLVRGLLRLIPTQGRADAMVEVTQVLTRAAGLGRTA